MKRMLFLAVVISMIVSCYAYCESSKYESRGKRDPFAPLIGQDKAQATGLSEVMSAEDIRLEGIAIGAKGKRTAIINGEIIKEGDKAGEVEIKTIDDMFVVLLISGKECKIDLPQEGGPKG